MKVFLILIFILTNLFKVYSINFKHDTVYKNDEIVQLYKIDNEIILIQKKNRSYNNKDYIVFVDSIAKDTLHINRNIFLNNFIDSRNKTVFFTENLVESYAVYSFHLETLELNKKIINYSNVFAYNNGLFYVGKSEVTITEEETFEGVNLFPVCFPILNLVLYNPYHDSNNIIYIYNNPDEFIGITDVVPLKNQNQLIICSGYLNSDYTTDNCKYIKYSISEKKEEDMTIINDLEKNLYSSYGLGTITRDINNEMYIDTNMFNENFEFIGNCLKSVYDICGYNIQNDRLSGFFIKESTDKKKGRFLYESVIINYPKNVKLDLLFYKTYHQKILLEKEVSKLDDFELILLEKMIYAKYNLKFEKLYFQAFFNTYHFYKDKQDTRLQSVDHLLTEIDKTNLKLIKEAEAELNSQKK